MDEGSENAAGNRHPTIDDLMATIKDVAMRSDVRPSSDTSFLARDPYRPFRPAGPSVSWVREQLQRFTYKPGWTFNVVQTNSYLGPAYAYLDVRFKAVDTYNPTREVEIGGTYDLLLLPADEDGFARRLASILKDMEVHESREWLRRDGEIFDNPHAGQ